MSPARFHLTFISDYELAPDLRTPHKFDVAEADNNVAELPILISSPNTSLVWAVSR
jgi:hypothetical protein